MQVSAHHQAYLPTGEPVEKHPILRLFLPNSGSFASLLPAAKIRDFLRGVFLKSSFFGHNGRFLSGFYLGDQAARLFGFLIFSTFGTPVVPTVV